MKHVKKSVLLPYSPHEMYALVVDVNRYPEFLPWCPKGEILSHEGNTMLARVHLAFAGIKQHFTTRNELDPDRSVRMRLHDGPFSHLDGGWRFAPIMQGDQIAGTRAEFELHYQFSSLPLQLVLTPVFDKIIKTFVECFTAQARKQYGPR